MKRVAVFLDRDGTINYDSDYLCDEAKLELLPGSADGIKLLNDAEFLTIVCTNQSGIARGYFSEDKLQQIHEKLKILLKEKGAFLDEIFYCPHHSDFGNEKYKKDCDCRKPKPGMIYKSLQKYDIDLQKSYVVGDKIADILFGKNLGLKTILVLTGYGQESFKRLDNSSQPDFVAKNLKEACEIIVSAIDEKK